MGMKRRIPPGGELKVDSSAATMDFLQPELDCGRPHGQTQKGSAPPGSPGGRGRRKILAVRSAHSAICSGLRSWEECRRAAASIQVLRLRARVLEVRVDQAVWMQHLSCRSAIFLAPSTGIWEKIDEDIFWRSGYEMWPQTSTRLPRKNPGPSSAPSWSRKRRNFCRRFPIPGCGKPSAASLARPRGVPEPPAAVYPLVAGEIGRYGGGTDVGYGETGEVFRIEFETAEIG